MHLRGESPSVQVDMSEKDKSELSLMVFNKPYDVLCQFTDSDGRETLANYINAPGFYAAGRLDKDSEGLLLLTNDGKLQQRISHPRFKLPKTYLSQVDGEVSTEALKKLSSGVQLKDGPARAFVRKSIPTSWITLSLKEGRNRQVRRMTAAVGFPTLRLIRVSIGACNIWPIPPGEMMLVPPDSLYSLD